MLSAEAFERFLCQQLIAQTVIDKQEMLARERHNYSIKLI